MNFKFWYSLKIPFIVIFKKKGKKTNKQQEMKNTLTTALATNA